MPGMRKTVIAAIILLGFSGVAAADPILIVRDGRSVSASGSIQGAVQFFNPPSIHLDVPASSTREQTQGDNLFARLRSGGRTGEVISNAFLISDISDPRHMSGFGMTETLLEQHSSGIGDPFSFFVVDAQAEADMIFAVNFRLESPFDFVFASSLFGDTAHTSLSGAGSVFFDLSRSLGPPFSQAGHLNPGDYALLVQDTASLKFPSPSTTGFQGGFHFTFDLTPSEPAPTPEPASLLLLGTGLAGVFGVRSHRSRAV